MSQFIFVYTLAIIVICCAASIFSLSTYAVTKRKITFVRILFFVAYTYEISDIFNFEWMQQNLVYSGNYYDITDPVGRIATGAIILTCLWVMLLDILDVHSKKLIYLPTLIYIVSSFAVIYLMPYGAGRQWLFYTLRQIYIIACLAYTKHHWNSSKDNAYKERLRRYSKQYKLLWVFTILIIIEDIYIIIFHPEPSAMQNQLPLYLSERNFSENAVMIFVAYYTCKEAFEALQLRYKEPPETTTDTKEDLERHIQDLLPAYSNKFELSPREQEVLTLVIAGNTNRQIADELFLSEGTIKTHVHNIMQKTNCKSRKELKMHFWGN